MPMHVPSAENPWSVGVEVPRPVNMTVSQPRESEYDAKHLGQQLEASNNKYMLALSKWEAELDTVRVKDFMGRLEEVRMDLRNNQDTGYKNLLGENALTRPSGKSLNEEVREQYKKAYEDLRAKAGNARQRRALDVYFKNSDLELANDVNTHVVQQQMRYKDAVLENNLNIAVRQAQDPDPKTANSGLVAARGIAQEIAEFHGMPVDMTKIMGPIHSARIGQMIDAGKLSAARSYIKENSSEISSADRQKLQRAMQVAGNLAVVKKTANEIIEKSKGSWFESLKMINAISDEKQRSSVDRIVRGFYKKQEELRTAENTERYNLAMEFLRKGEELPATFIAEFQEKDPKGYTDYLKAVDSVQFPVKVDDSSTLEELENLKESNPEQFVTLDLSRAAGYLTKNTIQRLQKEQRNLHKPQFQYFMKLVNDQITLNKIPRDQAVLARNAAVVLYDERTSQEEKKVLPKAVLDEMVKTVFGGTKPGWLYGFNKTKGYEEFIKNPKGGWQELTKNGFRPPVEDSAALEFIINVRQAAGIPNPADKNQISEEMMRLARNEISGIGRDPKLLQKAQVMAEKAARMHNIKKVEKWAIDTIYNKLAYGGSQNAK